jgi:hypothetical protein
LIAWVNTLDPARHGQSRRAELAAAAFNWRSRAAVGLAECARSADPVTARRASARWEHAPDRSSGSDGGGQATARVEANANATMNLRLSMPDLVVRRPAGVPLIQPSLRGSTRGCSGAARAGTGRAWSPSAGRRRVGAQRGRAPQSFVQGGPRPLLPSPTSVRRARVPTVVRSRCAGHGAAFAWPKATAWTRGG